jgi:hypothetical protein
VSVRFKREVVETQRQPADGIERNRMKPRWRMCGLAVVVFFAGLEQTTQAGMLDYQLGAGAFAGFTDNALGLPSGTPGSGKDGLILGRADVGLTLTRPFSEHRLAYAFTASQYIRQSGGKTLSNSLGWEAGFQPLTSLRLTTAVAATQGRLTALDVSGTTATGGPSAGPTGPRPASALLYASADARQGLSLDMGPRWRFLQALVAQGFWPLETDSGRPSSYSGQLDLGLERAFTRDGLSWNTRGLVMQSNPILTQGVETEPRHRSMVAEGDLGWRHTWTPVWSNYLAGGGMLISIPAGSTVRFQPAAQASVQARSETSELSLRVERTATPNVFAGDIFLSSRVLLTTSAAFGRTQQFELRGLGSFDKASAIGAAGENRGGATVWQARVVMTYGVPGPFLLSLEYAYTDQQADLPGSNSVPAFFSFRRNLVMLGLEVKYASLRPLAGGQGSKRIREAGNPAEDPRK